jgi:HemY protein
MRALLALVLLAAAVAAAVFFAENPGRVEIVWQGWLIGTSVGVLVGAVAVVAIVVAVLVLLVAGLRRTPEVLRRHRAARRQRAGETALTRGLVALAATGASRSATLRRPRPVPARADPGDAAARC